MRVFLLLAILSLVLVTSGCITETGQLPLKIIGEEPENVSEQVPENITVARVIPETEEEANVTEPGPTANETLNITEEAAPGDLCINVTCDDSITTCPDGEVMTCENACDNETGQCSSCIPDCSGHRAPEAEECTLTCGTCQTLNEEECECITKLYCDGNGICEYSNVTEKNEWPDGDDCKAFDSCDDGDEDTLDTFDPNRQACVHTDIACDDGDDCTMDNFNYETSQCEHYYICCGNNQCDPGDSDKCPEECEEVVQASEPEPEVKIMNISAKEEIVTLLGYGVDMTNWTLEDEGQKHVYTFPDDFIIDGTVYLYTKGCPGNNTDTTLYWGTKDGGCYEGFIWNDDEDNATLKDDQGDIVHTLEY